MPNPENAPQAAVHLDQIERHWRTMGISLGFSLLLAAGLVWLFWPVVPHSRLIVWLSLIGVAVGARFLVLRLARRSSARALGAQAWLQRIRLTFVLHGLAWAALVFAAPEKQDLLLWVTAAVGMATVAGAPLVLTSFDLRAAVLAAAPVGAALLWQVFAAGLAGISGLAGILALYVAAATANAVRSHRALRASIAARQRSAASGAALAGQHHLMAVLLETSPVGYWFIDCNGCTTDVNPAMCALLGRPRELIIGRNVIDFFEGLSLQRLQHELRSRSMGVQGRYEVELVRPDGTRSFCINSATPLHDAAGAVIGSVGQWIDITQRRREELTLRTYAFMVNSISDMVSVVDENRNYRMVNDAWAKRVGITRERVVGKDIELLGQTLSDARREAFQRCLASGGTQVVREVAGPGTPFGGGRVESTYYPYVDTTTDVRSVVVVTRDLTAEDAQRAALEESEQYLRRTLNATGDAIFASDAANPHEPVRFCNEQMLQMWGISLDHLHTLTPAEIMQHATPQFVDPDGQAREIAHIIATNAHHESRVPLKDGRVLLRRCVPALIRGCIVRVWSFRDITALEQAQHAMQSARDEADRANRAKSEFLGNVSHELRTPLNAILGFSEFLTGYRELPDAAREAAMHIGTAGGHLLALVDDMADLVRIEAGRLALSLEPVALDEVLAESVAVSMPLAAAHGITLAPCPDASGGAVVLADRVRLRQVVFNLLTNAIKYNTAGGSVSVACTRLAGRTRVSVHDTGSGIAPELQGRVFTPFERLGAERGLVEGTGIGLVICQRVVHAMEGTIGFESKAGQGSTFWFELPDSHAALPSSRDNDAAISNERNRC